MMSSIVMSTGATCPFARPALDIECPALGVTGGKKEKAASGSGRRPLAAAATKAAVSARATLEDVARTLGGCADRGVQAPCLFRTTRRGPRQGGAMSAAV